MEMSRAGTGVVIFLWIVTIFLWGVTVYYTMSPGKIETHPPSGYGFIRGMDPFPSDHIILPIEWENTGGTAVVIKHPYLFLRELDDGESAGNEYCFLVAGDCPDISSKMFREGYTNKESFIIEPHTITKEILIFHIENWWDNKSADYNFTFIGGKNYSVYMGYKVNKEHNKTVLFDKMPIYPLVTNLSYNSSDRNWYEYFSVSEGCPNDSK